MKTTSYKVLTVPRYGTLENAVILLSTMVERYLDSGWVLQGGVSLERYDIAQAVVHYEEPGEAIDA